MTADNYRGNIQEAHGNRELIGDGHIEIGANPAPWTETHCDAHLVQLSRSCFGGVDLDPLRLHMHQQMVVVSTPRSRGPKPTAFGGC